MNKDETYYIFIEEYDDNVVVEKFVVRIYKDLTWHVESISGQVPYDLETSEFDREDVIDDILEQLRDDYDYVQEINFSEIEDYMDDGKSDDEEDI